jgi:SOS-response transcriptional repressor LexA
MAAGLSQAELARRAAVSRKQLTLIEKNQNVSIAMIAKLAAQLPALTTLSLRDRRVTADSSVTEVDVSSIERAAEAAAEKIADIQRAVRPMPVGARVLQFPANQKPRITFAEEKEQLDELRRAFENSPDAEFRKPFKGRKKYVVPRGIDAAAGAGAELLTPVEEEEQLREIPEHYWEERGARMVLRARGNSLILRGIVDRDLLFVRPTTTPKNGEIIACRVNNQALVKIFEKKADRIRLCSANPKFRDIDVDPSDSFHCFGVVVGRSGYGLKTAEDLK